MKRRVKEVENDKKSEWGGKTMNLSPQKKRIGSSWWRKKQKKKKRTEILEEKNEKPKKGMETRIDSWRIELKKRKGGKNAWLKCLNPLCLLLFSFFKTQETVDG